jgi:hypothetical protein
MTQFFSKKEEVGMCPEPYIGLSGFTSHMQVRNAMTSVLPRGSQQLVMIGVLVTHETLHRRGSTNYPLRYPSPEELGKIFLPDDGYRFLNLLHFATKKPDELYCDLCYAQDLAGEYCHGFQLNMPWPEPDTLSYYKKRKNNNTLVLQCGREALEICGNDPAQIAKKVQEYEGLVDYVLIDPSGGEGKPFDPEFVLRCFDELRALRWPSFGVAGGLRYKALEPLRNILDRHPFFSIDAESGLRDADDHFDGSAAYLYLEEAVRLLAEYRDT